MRFSGEFLHALGFAFRGQDPESRWLHGSPGRKGQDSPQGPLPLLLAWRAPSVSSTLAPQKKQGRPEPPAHRGQQQNLCPHGTCQRAKSTKEEILKTAGDKESQIKGGNFS